MPRRKRQPEPPAEFGWVVRVAPVRSGSDTKDLYLCDPYPNGGCGSAVGISDLQHARFHTGGKDAAGQGPYEQACGYAHWQLGTPVFAKRQAGHITVLE